MEGKTFIKKKIFLNHYQNYPQNIIQNFRGNFSRGGIFRGKNNFQRGLRGAQPYNFQLNYFNIPNIYQNFPIHRKPLSLNIQRNEPFKNSDKYIYYTYPELIDINEINSGILNEINTDCKFFIIKSNNEENIHKSIKYGVWSSSKKGNKLLSDAFDITKEIGSFVYLIYSCNGTGKYSGIAKMKTRCDYNKTFNYWTQDNRWPGLFDVEWKLIKDVPFEEFKNIIIIMKNKELKPVIFARDTQKIPFEQAKKMLTIIEKYKNSTSVLDYFKYYDLRQDNYERKKNNIEEQD